MELWNVLSIFKILYIYVIPNYSERLRAALCSYETMSPDWEKLEILRHILIALSVVFAGWIKAFSEITLAYYNFFKSRSIPVAVSAEKAQIWKWIFHRDDARCWFVDFMQH